MLLVGLVAVALLLVVVGLLYLDLVRGSVTVSTIHLTSTADTCGLNGESLVGFTSAEGASVHESLGVHNADPSASCTISSVTSTTAGFVVSNANTPVDILPSSSQTLAFTIQVPDSPFSGSITLDVE